MKGKIITGAVVVLIVSLLAIPKLHLFSNGEEAKGPATTQSRLLAEAMIVQPDHLDNRLVVTGSIISNESLELKSEAPGKVTRIFFQEGKRVRKGDLLVETNDDEIRAQLEKQKFNKKLYEDNEYRQRRLLEKDAISQEEYDLALNTLNTTSADIRVLEAQLEKTRILAPFDGVVGLRYISEGAYITPNDVVATLYSLTPAKIEFAVPGRYSTKVKQGKKVFFTVENDSQTFEGEVYAVEPQIDPATRTLRIRALADNRSGRLLPGQFVKVELILESIDNALLIPTEAIIPELDGHKVFIAENGKAREVTVEIGIRTDKNVEILTGLTAGDTLVTTGLLTIKPGVLLDLQMK